MWEEVENERKVGQEEDIREKMRYKREKNNFNDF